MSNEVSGVNGVDPNVNYYGTGVNPEKESSTANAFEDENVSLGTDTDSFVSSASGKKTEPKDTKKADDGRDYVNVQTWGTGKDDCLSRIIEAHYGIDPYSRKGQEIMQAVMAENPQIYNSGRKAIVGGKIVDATDENKTETIIKNTDKMYLPTITGDGATTTLPKSKSMSSDQTSPTTSSGSSDNNSSKVDVVGIGDFWTSY